LVSNEYYSSNLDDSYKRLNDSVKRESRKIEEKPLIVTFMLSDQEIDYEIPLFDVIEFKRVQTNNKPILETEYPIG
jgi:hypothetical protein